MLDGVIMEFFITYKSFQNNILYIYIHFITNFNNFFPESSLEAHEDSLENSYKHVNTEINELCGGGSG